MRLYLILLSLFVCDMANAVVKPQRAFNGRVDVTIYNIKTKGFLEISVYSDSVYFMRYYDRQSDETVQLEAKDTALYEYVRESIMHFYYYKDARMYKYYKRMNSCLFENPEPPSIEVYVYDPDRKRKLTNEIYYLPFDVNVKTPQQILNDKFVYTDEYARFLDTLLYLDRNYSSDNEATTGDNEY